jgi:aryl-alcohol dehydrogenase-like predicted oxidoreductase
MQKTTHVFPILGGRKVEQLMQNIEALDIALTPEQIAFIESVIAFDPGFPNNMMVRVATPGTIHCVLVLT